MNRGKNGGRTQNFEEIIGKKQEKWKKWWCKHADSRWTKKGEGKIERNK